MAGKKKGRKTISGKKPARGKSDRPEFSEQLPFHPAMMDAMWRQMAPPAETPLELAQNLIYQAYGADPEQCVALAQQALAICPDCAEAYVLLGESAESLEEAIALFREGMAAGERALGAQTFQRHAGMFWGLVETRPYMRARMSLAQRLWSTRNLEEAVEHYQELLRLNPNDNQGARYELAACLLELGRDQELAALLSRYDDDGSAAWAYSRALLAFRLAADTEQARLQLKTAQQVNPFVPEYLLGSKGLPLDFPDLIGRGDENEAVSYAATYLPGWKATPGAITWLRNNLIVEPPPAKAARRTSWQKESRRYAALPQQDEVWQVDVCRPEMDAGTIAPWSVLIVDAQSSDLLDLDMAEERPTDAEVWEILLSAMQHPHTGEPRRPLQIEVRNKSLAKQWRSKLKTIGVDCCLCDELPQLDEMLEIAAKSAPLADRDMEIDMAELAALPQIEGEHWQADCRQLAAWIHISGNSPSRPWIAIVTNPDEQQIVGQEVFETAPGDDVLWRQLGLSMLRPLAGKPHRPAIVQVSTEPARLALASILEQLGIECVVSPLDQIDFILEELSQQIAGPDKMAALVDVPGVMLEQVGSFFQAAAAFYISAPWRYVAGDTPIKFTCPKFESGTWYAVVMGQSGMTLGLALYDDLAKLKRLLAGEFSDVESARQTSAISLTFGEAFEIAPRDLEAAERLGWDLAGPEAFPQVLRVNRGGNVRPPLGWELELLEAAVRTLPEFLSKKSIRQATTVSLASGPLAVELKQVD